jgi:hypothetical protein
MTDKKARPGPWTDAENAAGWALYFVMHKHAAAGEQYNKAAMVRAAQCERYDHGRTPNNAPYSGVLATRSRPSIEMKLMNMSAVMESIGRPDISMSEHGYRAMPNYQANLKTMGVALLAVRDEAVAGGFEVQA